MTVMRDHGRSANATRHDAERERQAVFVDYLTSAIACRA
jgi:hypothetical protein